jgi:uncharacterized membrane protein
MTTPAHIDVTGALLGGFGAFIFSSLGVAPAVLFWAMVGASLGVSFAAPASRARSVVVFIAAALACSLFGSWIALHYLSADSQNMAACALGIFFHPLLNAGITNLPRLVELALKKAGLTSSEGK